MKLSIFSDIHGDEAALSRLMSQEADYYIAAGDLVNWGQNLKKLGPLMQQRADRVYVLPGNHESSDDVAEFCSQYGFHNFHETSFTVGEHLICGLGYSNLTPFHTPGEYSEQEIEERLARFGRPHVLICHCPPKNTKLDEAGPGEHYGSAAIRKFIEDRQPAYFYCGHIHEAAGATDRIGETFGYNVGKTGRILELV
jgi:Icc-related predicted phosphoesterase